MSISLAEMAQLYAGRRSGAQIQRELEETQLRAQQMAMAAQRYAQLRQDYTRQYDQLLAYMRRPQPQWIAWEDPIDPDLLMDVGL